MLSNDNKYLERAYAILNNTYFEGSLPEVVITIQSSPKTYGHISVNRIWKAPQTAYHEINISAENLDRPIENTLATLTHEMVHLYCMMNGINDTSKGGKYHNKYFKQQAEKCDLIIEYANYIGYSVTSPSLRFIEILKQNGLFEAVLSSHRITMNATEVPPMQGGKPVKKKSSTRKYICPCCGINVRATKDVYILCGDCMAVMETVE